jgi:spoIIIJ-associated protein
MMKAEEFEGKTVDQAIEEASKYFQVAPEELEIEIITHGSTGIFGIGAKKAKIRARIKPEKFLERRATEARLVLTEILSAAGLNISVTLEPKEEIIRVKLSGEDKEFLLTRNGRPLNALEYLVNKIVARRLGIGPKIVLDINGFRARQERKVREIARRAAERARKTRRPVELKPMPAHARRLVHLTLRHFPGVQTKSRGQGEARRVVIYPEPSRRR